jgi:hypothetical protein
VIRFLAWLGWEWRSHYKLLLGALAGSVLALWGAALLAARNQDARQAMESIVVILFALLALVLASGLFGSERRHGAEPLVLRLPGARVPLFAARLAFLVSALGGLALLIPFLAARFLDLQLHPVQSVQGLPPPPELGLLLWPRWIIADLAVVALTMAVFGLLASAWTRRSALALCIGLFLPVLLALPLFVLTTTRTDFYDIRRLGAAPLAAWPALALALVALAVSWLHGQRFLNGARRAVGLGVLVLLVGSGIGAAWTAAAFASFDTLDPADEGFRLVSWRTRHGNRPSPGLHRPVALATGGRYLYAYGLRVDCGLWPEQVTDTYGAGARAFDADRGTWSKPVRIDLETGAVTTIGGVHARLSWFDLSDLTLGAGRSRLRVNGFGSRGSLEPKSHAWLENGDGRGEHRILSLQRPQEARPPLRELGASLAEVASIQVAASAVPVQDASGRPVWLQFKGYPLKLNRSPEPKSVTGQIVREDGSTVEVTTPAIRWWNAPQLANWQAQTGCWSLRTYNNQLITVDATTGVVRTTTEAQIAAMGDARPGPFGPFILGPRYALVARPVVGDAPRRYRLLDLETHAVGPELTGANPMNIVPHALSDGRLLCRERQGDREALVLWDPRAYVRTPVKAPMGFFDVPLARIYPNMQGTDRRDNIVLVMMRYVPGKSKDMTVQSVLFRAATADIVPLCEARPVPQGTAFEAIGIDAQDRVVGLDGFDGHGYTQVVRVDPADGSRTVLFPRK